MALIKTPGVSAGVRGSESLTAGGAISQSPLQLNGPGLGGERSARAAGGKVLRTESQWRRVPSGFSSPLLSSARGSRHRLAGKASAEATIKQASK